MRVIIADDHRIVREGIRWMLENEQSISIVGEAGSGQELLALLDEVDADVVLLDIRMPDMSGLEVLAALQEREDAPPALMLSMYHEPGLVQQAIALGAAGYLKKSTGRDEMIHAIRTVGSGEAFLQGDLVAPLVRKMMDDDNTPCGPALSSEECVIMRLVAAGCSNREIAAELGTTETTVRMALQAIFKRLGVHSRSEAVAVALRTGSIE